MHQSGFPHRLRVSHLEQGCCLRKPVKNTRRLFNVTHFLRYSTNDKNLVLHLVNNFCSCRLSYFWIKNSYHHQGCWPIGTSEFFRYVHLNSSFSILFLKIYLISLWIWGDPKLVQILLVILHVRSIFHYFSLTMRHKKLAHLSSPKSYPNRYLAIFISSHFI